MGAIGIGRVDMGDAFIQGSGQDGVRLRFVGGAVEIAEGHGANPNGRDHGTVLAKLTLFHVTCSLCIGGEQYRTRANPEHTEIPMYRRLFEVATANEMGRRHIAVEHQRLDNRHFIALGHAIRLGLAAHLDRG